MTRTELTTDAWVEVVADSATGRSVITATTGSVLVRFGADDPAQQDTLLSPGQSTQSAPGQQVRARRNTPVASVTVGAADLTSYAGQAIVTDGQEIAVTGGTVTLTVEAGVVSAEFTPEE